MLGVIDRDLCLHIRPLGNEIGERLRLYRLAGPEVDGVGANLTVAELPKLYGPHVPIIDL
jgi:hypothetical protein